MLAGWQFPLRNRSGCVIRAPPSSSPDCVYTFAVCVGQQSILLCLIQRAIRKQEEVLYAQQFSLRQKKNEEKGEEKKNGAGMQSMPKHQRERLYRPDVRQNR